MKINSLSILLPSYNNHCYTLVQELQRQASAINGLLFEVIVADDGSRDQVALLSNYLINELPNCRFIRRQQNVGRAAIRNFLAQEAQYEWLMFMDSDVSIRHDDFISRYVDNDTDVVYGGVEVDKTPIPGNLRHNYELQAEPLHTAQIRQKEPYKHFHTANFMIRKALFDSIKFDERIKQYGYEDVLFGKCLKHKKASIQHIDNPVCLDKFEANESFLRKIETSMMTLHSFQTDLKGYSTLLDGVERMKRWHIIWALRLWHRVFGNIERRNLAGAKPSLTVLKIYKLGFFTTIKD